MNFKKTMVFLGCAVLMGAASLSAQIKIKNGEKIAFLGDSITQQGHNLPTGYVNLVRIGLKVNGIQPEVVKAGISGNKSNDMLNRLDRDVISKKPQIMTLSCGVNDVWHGVRGRGIKLEDYKKNITAIVDKALAANIQVYIMTATMIGEDQKNANNQKLVAYNEFLCGLAKEKNLPLIDLNAVMQKDVASMRAKYPGLNAEFVTTDGVHMAPLGNAMMAKEILKAFGLNDSQLAKAEAEWMKLKWSVQGVGNFTVKDFNTIQEKLWAKNTTMRKYLNEKVQELLK